MTSEERKVLALFFRTRSGRLTQSLIAENLHHATFMARISGQFIWPNIMASVMALIELYVFNLASKGIDIAD
jgi:predicted small integral membrane protein